jgi:hypothetical protein
MINNDRFWYQSQDSNFLFLKFDIYFLYITILYMLFG